MGLARWRWWPRARAWSRDGQLARTALPLATLLATSSFLPVVTIVTVAKELHQTLGAARRFFAVEDEPVPVRDGPARRCPRRRSASRFEDVTFAYGAAERPALRDVEFRGAAGQDRRARRPLGRGQDHRRAPAAALLGPAVRAASLIDGHDVRELRLDDLRG